MADLVFCFMVFGFFYGVVEYLTKVAVFLLQRGKGASILDAIIELEENTSLNERIEVSDIFVGFVILILILGAIHRFSGLMLLSLASTLFATAIMTHACGFGLVEKFEKIDNPILRDQLIREIIKLWLVELFFLLLWLKGEVGGFLDFLYVVQEKQPFFFVLTTFLLGANLRNMGYSTVRSFMTAFFSMR